MKNEEGDCKINDRSIVEQKSVRKRKLSSRATKKLCASAGDFSFFALPAKAIYKEINNK